MKEIILKVNGMHCEGCEKRINNALMNIKGVKSIIANHSNGTVEVKLNEDIANLVIEEKIEDLGFEVIKDNK